MYGKNNNLRVSKHLNGQEMHSPTISISPKKTRSTMQQEVGIMEVSNGIEFVRYFANKKDIRDFEENLSGRDRR